ncbi:virion structural protein [Cyanophage S-TIM54]|nr:virion structural protein [Cyanophage S-TIM54]
MTSPKKITQFTAATTVADEDLLLVVDTNDTTSSADGTTKKATFSTLENNVRAGLNITNWDTAYGWGNHATAGYQTDFTETDPVFTAHVSSGITSTKIGQWDAAYGWGNHAVQGYLQSIAAQSIDALNDVAINTGTLATNQVLKWNGTSWVNGAGGGGTTIDSLNDINGVTVGSPTNNQVLKYNSATSQWTNQAEAGGIALTDFSITTGAASSSPSLTYDSGTGVFTYTPPDLSGLLSDVVNDTTPQLGGNLSLNSHTINGTGNINISGQVKGNFFNFKQNNSTIAGTSGNNRDIKVIGGVPFYYDGTAWREFYLIDGSVTTVQPDTDWDDVLIRSTFDSNINDVKYNVTPTVSNSSVIVVSSPYKVGTGSLRLNDEYIEYPMTSDYSFTGAWTFEAWIYFDNLPDYDSDPFPLFTGNSTTTSKNWGLYVSRASSGGNLMRFSWYNGNTLDKNNPYPNSTEGLLSNSLSGAGFLNAWRHIAISKDSSDGRIRLFIDGAFSGNLIDNDINDPDEIRVGGSEYYSINSDIFVDDLRVTKDTRYTATFTPSSTQLPVSGSTSQIVVTPRVIQGEIDLGSSPTWTGTPGATVAQQSSGNYRLTFATAFSSTSDYIVVAQPMDQSSASYVQATRATTHVDFEIKTQAAAAAVNNGSLAIQILKKA